MERGHDVVGLDTGFYREGWLYSDPTRVRVGPQALWKDLRRVALDTFKDKVNLDRRHDRGDTPWVFWNE